MKKRVIGFLLCLAMLAGLLPAGTPLFSALAEEYDYTDRNDPYVATNLEGLFEVFNKARTDGATRYVRLGRDIVETAGENRGSSAVFRTKGAPVVLDLAGYKLGITARFDRLMFFGDVGASITFEDSRRYDSAKSEWIDGRVEFRFDHEHIQHGESDTALLAGDIIVKGGIFKNNSHISGKINSIFSGNTLEMFGGTFEAEDPIILAGGGRGNVYGFKSCVIHDGTLRVGREVAITAYERNFQSDLYPVIEKCRIENVSGNGQVAAFNLKLKKDFAENHTAADAFAIFDKAVPRDVYAYIDGEIQPKGNYGILYSGDSLIGPLFRSSYVLTPVTFIGDIMIHAANIKAGEELSYYAGAPSGTGYSVDTAYTTGKYWKEGVYWKNIAYNSHTRLEVGKSYTVSFRVKLNDPYAYRFADEGDITATVNGNPARVIPEGDVCTVYYDFTAQPNSIERIALFLTEPKVGEAPVYSATVPSGADYRVDTANAVSGFHNGMSWMDGIAEMAEGAKFASGHTYNVLVIVNSADYQTARFADAGSITATINGKTANVIPYSADRYGIYCTFSLDPTVIDTLDLTLPEPKEGERIVYDARIAAGHGYTIENRSDGVAWEEGVKWTNRGMTLNPQDENRFEAGETYTVSVSLVLTDKTVFTFANLMDIEAYVNDKRADYDRLSDSNVTVSYTFTVPYDPSAVITVNCVSVSVFAPVAFVPRTYIAQVPENAGYQVMEYENDFYGHGVAWALGDEAENDLIEIGIDEAFYPDQIYTVYVYLTLTDPGRYAFAEKEEFTAYVNGEEAQSQRIDDQTYLIRYAFPMVEDLVTVVWYLDAAAPEYTAGAEIPRGEVFGDPPEPFRPDAVFAGWYTDRALTEPYDPTAPITKDTELFPRWESLTGFILGDADGDGKITSTDARLVLQLSVGKIHESDLAVPAAADVDGDGSVTSTDARLILQYSVGKITEWP